MYRPLIEMAIVVSADIFAHYLAVQDTIRLRSVGNPALIVVQYFSISLSCIPSSHVVFGELWPNVLSPQCI